MAEEGVAAQLAVGDHVEAGLLLEPHRLVDRAVLDLLERGGGELAALELVAGGLELGRAQQAAYHVAADRLGGHP